MKAESQTGVGGREKKVKKGCRMTPAVKVTRHSGEGPTWGPELQVLLSPQPSSQSKRSLSMRSHADKAGRYLQWDGCMYTWTVLQHA